MKPGALVSPLPVQRGNRQGKKLNQLSFQKVSHNCNVNMFSFNRTGVTPESSHILVIWANAKNVRMRMRIHCWPVVPSAGTMVHIYDDSKTCRQTVAKMRTLNDVVEVAVVGAVVQQAVPELRPGRTLSKKQSQVSEETRARSRLRSECCSVGLASMRQPADMEVPSRVKLTPSLWPSAEVWLAWMRDALKGPSWVARTHTKAVLG